MVGGYVKNVQIKLLKKHIQNTPIKDVGNAFIKQSIMKI